MRLYSAAILAATWILKSSAADLPSGIIKDMTDKKLEALGCTECKAARRFYNADMKQSDMCDCAGPWLWVGAYFVNYYMLGAFGKKEHMCKGGLQGQAGSYFSSSPSFFEITKDQSPAESSVILYWAFTPENIKKQMPKNPYVDDKVENNKVEKRVWNCPAPTKAPTPSPSYPPTPSPTDASTPYPTYPPTPSPTDAPTPSPDASTPYHTYPPMPSPTDAPTPSPTYPPTPSPTDAPTPSPTYPPTYPPTPSPTPYHTYPPTPSPTDAPTPYRTYPPTPSPTDAPQRSLPTTPPSGFKPKTRRPTRPRPTRRPTRLPTTRRPTRLPTNRPTKFVCPVGEVPLKKNEFYICVKCPEGTKLIYHVRLKQYLCYSLPVQGGYCPPPSYKAITSYGPLCLQCPLLHVPYADPSRGCNPIV
jgi:hypothetical protein